MSSVILPYYFMSTSGLCEHNRPAMESKFNTSPLALVSGRSEFPQLMLYSYFGTLAAWQLCPFCLFGSVL